MFSGQPDVSETEFSGYHQVESWNGKLPYLNLKSFLSSGSKRLSANVFSQKS